MKESVIRKLFLKELKKYEELEDIPDLIGVKTLNDFQKLLDNERIYILYELNWGLNFFIRCQHGIANVLVNRVSLDNVSVSMNVITEKDIDILVEMIISK